MIGGQGNDTYYLIDASEVKALDVIVEKSGEGTDTVLSAVYQYILAAEIENLTLVEGGNGIFGTGNKSNNIIIGNSNYDNILNGKEGDDTLTGEAGSDIFKFDTRLTSSKTVKGTVITLSNVDTITDFKTSGDLDVIDLAKSIFSKALVDAADTDKSDGKNLAINDLVSRGTLNDAIMAQGNAHFLYDTSTFNLYYDVDGSKVGGKEAILFATLTGVTTLSASDLHIV